MTSLLNPLTIYIVGMVLVVILAVISCLSVVYYIKAKNLVPFLYKEKVLQQTLDELQNKVKEQETELINRKAEILQAEKLVQEQKEAEQWLLSHKEEMEALKIALEKMHIESELAKSQKEDWDRKLEELQKRLSEYEEKVKAAEQKLDIAEKEAFEIRRESAELSIQVPALRKEAETLRKEIEELRGERNDLEQNIDALKKEISLAQGELERLNGNIQAKKAELASVEKQMKDRLAELQAELKALQMQIAKERENYIELESRANVARGVLSDLNAKREESNDKWKNLDTPIVSEKTLRKVGSSSELNENRWLEDFSKGLEDNGFIFDSRSILAFHTGLKCARQTPLVVLAGISGTGKSLLPELYAASLGMNFLPVPVQPRWDSPQDLFGFYNYMEGRYKATELSRLLWQFDFYNGPAKKRYTPDTLPLSLVLLDEMNLARVEYYFSDLLSKLETRNGLNADDEVERKKAEIELECNAADKMDSMRRLFVSPYTLFVGTMNEDESTQSLSDKVIDRANMLRFGRPKMIGTSTDEVRREPNKSAFLASFANKPRISSTEWESWCKTLAETGEAQEKLDFLRDTITSVVEPLDKIYRSYGFRVDKAMKLYVMNYPGDVKDAVADQIEMKILPKLNGVELQDENFEVVKAALLGAIETTGDAKLREAFESACPENGTFFKWRGVMR